MRFSVKRAACSIPAFLSALAIFTSAEAGISCYGGGTLGHSSFSTDASLNVAGVGTVAGIDSLGANGISGGITGGCDWTQGRWLVGAWGDIMWHGSDFEVSSSLIGGSLVELSVDKEWGFGGRAGYFATETTLVYGLIGWSRVEPDDLEIPVLGVSFDTEEADGLVVGGGIEVEVAPQVTLAAEYRFTTLEDNNVGIVPGVNLNLDTDIHTARAVAKYRFDWIR